MRTTLRCFGLFLLIFGFLGLSLPHAVLGAPSDLIAFVSDGGDPWTNWDIYLRDLGTGVTTRLTTHPAIDNHPEIHAGKGWVVFSSNRGPSGEFDLYLGDLSDVEGTLRPSLTNDDHPNGPAMAYPDRHPHFHPNGQMVIFSSKNRPLDKPIAVISECSVPKIIVPPRFYEGINIIKLDLTGNRTGYEELDIRTAWNAASFFDIWVDHAGTYVGHPSFNSDGTKIVFSGSIDGEGKVWEVYTVDFDPVTVSLVPDSLRRRTKGPDDLTPNPIKMSGGAHFSADGTQILFSSTRTPGGNSQIFSIPAGGIDIPVTIATRLTNHAGNDYVPEPLDGGAFLVTSDLGEPALCGEGEGPTADLDLVLVDPLAETRVVLGTEDWQEMSLIGDEVSWFCGLKPNLSECTFQPRIFSTESLWLEKTAWLYNEGFLNFTLIPANLLEAFGYPGLALRMYLLGWMNMDAFMHSNNPAYWEGVLNDLQSLNSSGFPGLKDEAALRNWMQATETLRNKKHVVPSIMYDIGVGAPPVDLTGQLSVTQSCKETPKGPNCKLSGTLNVENTGIADAPSSVVRFYLSNSAQHDPITNVLLKQVSTGKLKSGQRKAKKLSYTLKGERATNMFVIAVIDADRTVPEANESNNAIVSGQIP